MKKVFSLMMMFAVIALVACGGKKDAENADNQPAFSKDKALELAETINNAEAQKIDDKAFDEAVDMYVVYYEAMYAEAEKYINEKDENKLAEAAKVFDEKYKGGEELSNALLNAYFCGKLTEAQAKKYEEADKKVEDLRESFLDKYNAANGY